MKTPDFSREPWGTLALRGFYQVQHSLAQRLH
jgi:hypothetical protein